MILIFVDCSMSCADGSLNANCTFCQCSSRLEASVFTTDNRTITDAHVTHSNAPDVVLNTTSSTGIIVVENICSGDEFVLRSDDFEDLRFTFNDNVTSTLQMDEIGRAHV